MRDTTSKHGNGVYTGNQISSKTDGQNRSNADTLFAVSFPHRRFMHLSLSLEVKQWFRNFTLPFLGVGANRKKVPDLWQECSWFLLHEIIFSPSGRSSWKTGLQDFCLQLPCSPYLSPADFSLFPKLKVTLEGCQFESTEQTQEKTGWGTYPYR